MTNTTRRAHLADNNLSVVVPRQSTLFDLENPICDLDRAARIAFLVTMHIEEDPSDKELGIFAVEQVERLASELRASFYAISEGRAVGGAA